MSLLDAMMDDFVLMEKKRVEDGAGGFTTTYVEGAPFRAAIVMDSTMQAKVAEKQGVSSVYTITTPKSVVLEYHDVVLRLSDLRYFRVTSDGADKSSPSIASLDMRQVSAEKWEVTKP